MSYPKCFNSQAEHAQWVALAKRSNAKPDWPCLDCTLSYQQLMTEAGRCEHPEAIPGKAKPCPAPSADDKPEASSGNPRKRGRKTDAKTSDSAPSAAKPSSARSGKRKRKGSATRKKRRFR